MDNLPKKDGDTQQTMKTPQGDFSLQFLFFGREVSEKKLRLLHTFSEMQRVYLCDLAKNSTGEKQIEDIAFDLYLIEKLLFHS